MSNRQPSGERGSARPRGGLALLAILGIVGLYLVPEHGAHLLVILPFLFLCPLLHLFMHGGHRGHSRHNAARNSGGKGGER